MCIPRGADLPISIALLWFILNTVATVFILERKLDNAILLLLKTRQNKPPQRHGYHGPAITACILLSLQAHPTATFLLAAFCAQVMLSGLFLSVLAEGAHAFCNIMFFYTALACVVAVLSLVSFQVEMSPPLIGLPWQLSPECTVSLITLDPINLFCFLHSIHLYIKLLIYNLSTPIRAQHPEQCLAP